MDLNWINDISPALATFLLAMLPIAELRLSIPIALGALELPLWQAYIFSVIGNYIPAVLILYFFGPISKFLSKDEKIFAKFFSWLFTRTRNKFDKKYKTWGNIALLLFVAIPLPVTGAWTGALAAWLFGINKKDSLLYILLGILLSGIIVSLISLGVFKFI